MANLLRSLSKITRNSLLLGLGFITFSTFSCSTESSSGDDIQDNGLTLMQQIVQPLKDNIKKEMELWGGDEDAEGDLETFKEYATKIKAHKEIIKAHPENAQAYLDLVEAIDFHEAFNPEGDDKSRQTAYLKMVRWLNTAIKNQPSNKELHRKRAKVYSDNQQYPKGLADYTHIIEKNPLDGRALLSRGRVHEKMGHPKEAQKDIDTYLRIKPTSAEQYYWRGMYHYMKGHFVLAEKDFSKSVDLDPNYESAYFFRAEIYFALNRFDDSNVDYKKSLELEPLVTGFSLGRMGMNYYYQGKYKTAEEVLAKCLRVAPSLDAVAWWYLSRQKQSKSSQAALEHIVEHFGDEHLDGAVIHLFLDKLSPEALLKKKGRSNITTIDISISMAHYYVGQYYLMRGDAVKARAMFEKSIQEGKELNNPGRLFSEKELARLKSDSASGTNDRQ